VKIRKRPWHSVVQTAHRRSSISSCTYSGAHNHDILSLDLMSITVMLHDPVNVSHQITPGLIERLVNVKLGFFDDKSSLFPARLQRKVEVSSNRFPVISQIRMFDLLCRLSARFDEFGPSNEPIQVLLQTTSHIDGH
jgi:hypothetical protein